MFQVILIHCDFCKVKIVGTIEQALAHARFLRCIYYGYENEIPPADAIIMIKAF